MKSRGIPPRSLLKVNLLSRIFWGLSDKLSLKGKDSVWKREGVKGNGRGDRVQLEDFDIRSVKYRFLSRMESMPNE